MKKFEIEVVRTYTTTIEIDSQLSKQEIDEILHGTLVNHAVYHDIWDSLAEAELEQMNTDLQEIKVKTLVTKEDR